MGAGEVGRSLRNWRGHSEGIPRPAAGAKVPAVRSGPQSGRDRSRSVLSKRGARGAVPRRTRHPPPRLGRSDPRVPPRSGRATHMCGFLRKALVRSFTTRRTSTATSSLVSAMSAAASGGAHRPEPEFRGERARAGVCAGSAAPPPPPPLPGPPGSTSGSIRGRRETSAGSAPGVLDPGTRVLRVREDAAGSVAQGLPVVARGLECHGGSAPGGKGRSGPAPPLETESQTAEPRLRRIQPLSSRERVELQAPVLLAVSAFELSCNSWREPPQETTVTRCPCVLVAGLSSPSSVYQ